MCSDTDPEQRIQKENQTQYIGLGIIIHIQMAVLSQIPTVQKSIMSTQRSVQQTTGFGRTDGKRWQDYGHQTR